MGSEEDRNRLKEEYKAHYLEIKQLKQKLAEAERRKKIEQAMHNIDPTSMMDAFDQSLQKLQQSALEAEVKLDMALSKHQDAVAAEEADERLKKQSAAGIVDQLRQEIITPSKNPLDQSQVVKTIGRKKEDS